jgi:hypothetical protein
MQSERESLRGVFRLSVSRSDGGELTNLTSTDPLVRALAQKGVEILPNGEYPRLVISVNSVSDFYTVNTGSFRVWAVSAELELYQKVTLGTHATLASTYSRSNVMLAGDLAKRDAVAQIVRDMIAEFGKDLGAANVGHVAPVSAEHKKHPFVGFWTGTTSCPTSKTYDPGSGQFQVFQRQVPTEWTIQDSTAYPGGFDITQKRPDNQYTVDFMAKPNSDGSLEMWGATYGTIFISADLSTLHGSFKDDQKHCTAFSLHR